MNEKMLTVSDVAQLFEVTPYTVREWLKAGKLEGAKLVPFGGQWRIPHSAVVAFANKQYGEDSASH